MVEERKRLVGKRVIIVDDEPDILSALKETLDDCAVDTAAEFEEAQALISKRSYDVAILDIMGVRGYDLLKMTKERNIPTLMLTAHALSADDLTNSIKKGAYAYIPKEEISKIRIFLEDVLEAHEKGTMKPGKWFSRLEPYFKKRFGEFWKERSDPEFWKKYY
jgi:DNA-binding NtrC family response regulator